MNTLESLISSARNTYDLSDSGQQLKLYRLVDALFNLNVPEKELLPMAADTNLPLEFRIAIHLWRSKKYLSEINRKIKIGVVFAMWGEHHRLLPKSMSNPNGEDTLQTKMEQLSWAFETTSIDWKVYAVDDGCPHMSGKIAENIRQTHQQKEKIEILYLKEALPEASGPLRKLKSVDDSKKGGAIILGCQQAIAEGAEVVIYTDADNSVPRSGGDFTEAIFRQKNTSGFG